MMAGNESGSSTGHLAASCRGAPCGWFGERPGQEQMADDDAFPLPLSTTGRQAVMKLTSYGGIRGTYTCRM
jgi:hypothetical protein